MENNNVFVIAEIGINHNGDVELAKKLIDMAALAGADAVKFQKRTLDKVYHQDELDKPRESPWGTTNREQKAGLEFGKEEFDVIDTYCKEKNIHWFASAWDVDSQEWMQQYDCQYNKIASPRLGHKELLEMVAKEGKYTFISTGMAELPEIEQAVKIFKDNNCPFELMHCTSTYPSKPEELNLNCIKTLREKFDCKVGYSGHETGIATTVAAVALGATSVERHITLDRAMYGSDQAASVEPQGFMKLVRDIRVLEKALGDGVKRVYDSERPIIEKLKRGTDLN
jgi:N-acetylneuraminate synthase